MKHPIPRAALDDRLGFLGTSGSGKTYNAGTAVEILLAQKSRVVIIDPLGVWWGLRLQADGRSASPFNVAIFGGPHGDLPLTEHTGALLGETAATMAESCIIDLSELKTRSAERRFMVAFLEAIYRSTTGEPFHLVVDEADLFAPQKPQAGDEVLLGHMENIVRRGRVKGFISWLISQRPAVLNKNVLSMVDGLLAFKLTSPQDRDALDAWIEGQADKAQGKEIKGNLPTLQIGQGVVWLPGHDILHTASFPEKLTFDSSRRLKRGEQSRRTKALKPVDLGRLKEKLAGVEAEAKANDPKLLRADIAKLRSDKTALEKQLAAAATKLPKPDPAAIEAAEQRGFERALKEVRKAADKTAIASMIGSYEELQSMVAPFSALLDTRIKEAKKFKVSLEGVTFTPAPRVVPDATAARRVQALGATTADRLGVVKRAREAAPGGDGSIARPHKLIIDAIRWWNVMGVGAPTHAQTAFVAGYSHKSGTWSTYLSHLRSQGLIEGRGDLVLTETGTAAASDPQSPPSGEQLRATVIAKLDTPLTRILTPIMEAYPNGLSHQEAADAAGYSAQSGTWSTYLSRLRSLDLIDGRGDLKAQDWLFPLERAAA